MEGCDLSSEQSSFADIPFTARGHLGLLFYEAVCLLTCHLGRRSQAAVRPLKQAFESFPHLLPYWSELRQRFPAAKEPDQLLDATRAERRRWEQSCQVWLPIIALQKRASFTAESSASLVLAGLIEEDSGFGELFAAIQQPLAQRRPTLGLLRQLVQEGNTNFDAWNMILPLIDSGLLIATNPDAPRAEWAVRVPPPVWSALRGECAHEPLPGIRYHPPEDFSPIQELALYAKLRSQLAELVSLVEFTRVRTIAVRGLSGCPWLEILGSVAAATHRGLLVMDGQLARDENLRRLIGPVATLINAVPAFSFELGTGEVADLPSIAGYDGAVGIFATREGGLSGSLMERAVTIDLEPETPAQRLRYWQQELTSHSLEHLSPIANSFTLSGGHIRKAAKIAATHAALDGRSHILPADVRQATRALGSQRLDFLASRLEAAGNWCDLVVPASTELALRDLESRCRHRERLADLLDHDMPGGLNRGIRSLFEGPSGTGKTLAARILAAELGLDIYRVDLSAVMNKYIGETEKNLSRLLTRAEDLDVILLLDEGDSLMARRTDVKTAHDRYANLETNYLLQRLETYMGIAIITTNIGSAIDSAFRRRIDSIVRFQLPDPEERWRLWQLHLPAQHSVQPDELEVIALRYEMSGGQIRNASVQAALLALEDDQTRIAAHHLRPAIHAEYRKAGAAVPIEEISNGDTQERRLSGFLSAIS